MSRSALSGPALIVVILEEGMCPVKFGAAALAPYYAIRQTIIASVRQ